MFSQTRIFFAMARDGLFPPMFARLHERHRTPHITTITLGSVIAVGAGTLPIDILADLVSLGTALAFGTVAFTVMWLRVAQPDLHRPFRVPFGGIRVGNLWLGWVPVLAISFCALMVVMLAMDITAKAGTGNFLPAGILAGYLSLGAAIYLGYGRRNARRARLEQAPDA